MRQPVILYRLAVYYNGRVRNILLHVTELFFLVIFRLTNSKLYFFNMFVYVLDSHSLIWIMQNKKRFKF